MSEVQLPVLKAIGEAGQPIASKGLRALPALEDFDSKQISNALFVLKRSGLAAADDARRYRITAKGRQALAGDAGDEPALTATAPRKEREPPQPNAVPRADATMRDPVGAALAKSADEAQAALDTYLASVGDPAVIGPLKAARDQARRACDAYHVRDPS